MTHGLYTWDPYRTAWLLFMLADIPRLVWKLSVKRKPDRMPARLQRHRISRIVVQMSLQNSGYALSMGLLALILFKAEFAVLALTYMILAAMAVLYQVRVGSAYVTSRTGHAIHDGVLKPMRIVMALLSELLWGSQHGYWVAGS